MKLSLAGTRRDAGVSVAEVSLKLLWDVVRQIKVDGNSRAYVIDASASLIAHNEQTDTHLVLTDIAKLEHVRAFARDWSTQAGEDSEGRKVLTAYAPVNRPRWSVFVELPIKEATR